MKVGVTGSPQSGKTTLFRLLTNAGRNTGQSNLGVMEIPDVRVDFLRDIYDPRKTTYARIDVIDIQAHKGQELLNAVRNLDLVIVALASFMGVEGVKDSLEFINAIEADFYVADLVSVESRLHKLKANKAKPVSQTEIPFLEKCEDALNNEIPLRQIAFCPHEVELLSNFAFYTTKPLILALNVSDEQLSMGEFPALEHMRALSDSSGFGVVVFSGVVEEEIEALSEGERDLFLKEYGLTEPGVARIAKAAYSTLGLISFFTVGQDEVRAWTIKNGACAKEAAGKIHSDLERGFIRAEVVSYTDFKNAGSTKACKENGTLRLEGKDYLVKDGDILNIRFSV